MSEAGKRTIIETVGELEQFTGKTLGRTEWRRIDQETIDAFANATGDKQWIHTDPTRAADGPFGATIAHGYLTLALCGPIVFETLEVRGARMAVNYGLDRVRFPAPVTVESRVRGVSELVSAEPVPGGAQAVIRVVVETDGGSKPACVADTVTRFYE